VLWWVQQKHVSVAAAAAIPGAGDLLVTVLELPKGVSFAVLVQVRHGCRTREGVIRRSVSGFGTGGDFAVRSTGAEAAEGLPYPGSQATAAALLAAGNDDTRICHSITAPIRSLANSNVKGCTNFAPLLTGYDPNGGDAVAEANKRRDYAPVWWRWQEPIREIQAHLTSLIFDGRIAIV